MVTRGGIEPPTQGFSVALSGISSNKIKQLSTTPVAKNRVQSITVKDPFPQKSRTPVPREVWLEGCILRPFEQIVSLIGANNGLCFSLSTWYKIWRKVSPAGSFCKKSEDMSMKVVGFNGSPRKDGNTAVLIQKVFRELENEGMETELIQLSHKRIHGCVACYQCMEKKNERCAVHDDAANEYIEKIVHAQGVVLGSPVYFMDVTPEMKALIDRVGFVSRSNGGMLRNKVGCLLVAARRAGAVHTLDTMSHFFLSMDIIIVGRSIGIGRDIGDVEKDEEGMQLAQLLGKRMTWLLKRVYA